MLRQIKERLSISLIESLLTEGLSLPNGTYVDRYAIDVYQLIIALPCVADTHIAKIWNGMTRGHAAKIVIHDLISQGNFRLWRCSQRPDDNAYG